ncbi:uncharacterized protein LOC122912298 isoform X2 [Neovison vison]|nr:uncharacterized protein LOC122912298 isoform X2 [Neogale vison]
MNRRPPAKGKKAKNRSPGVIFPKLSPGDGVPLSVQSPPPNTIPLALRASIHKLRDKRHKYPVRNRHNKAEKKYAGRTRNVSTREFGKDARRGKTAGEWGSGQTRCRGWQKTSAKGTSPDPPARVHAHAWDGMISAPRSFLWLHNTPPPSAHQWWDRPGSSLVFSC